MFAFCKTPIEEEELLLITKLQVYFFIRINGEYGFLSMILKYFHLIYNSCSKKVW